MKIYLPETVRGDWPIGHHLVALSGYHDATRNQNGAMFVLLPDGELSVKPGEYKYVCLRCECPIDVDGCCCEPEGA